jgi:hypothetical protein
MCSSSGIYEIWSSNGGEDVAVLVIYLQVHTALQLSTPMSKSLELFVWTLDSA